LKPIVVLVIHGTISLALVGAYIALTVLNHDGSPILGVLVGYLGAAGVSGAGPQATGGSPQQ
jgi:hypothetical protein